MGNIHYLSERGKPKTRRLYETIFTEDSKAFVDYYYQWKTKDNEIIVMEEKDGGTEVMIHLNPYRLEIGGRCADTAYIVAVATRPDCRRQGKMQQVMEQALQDSCKKHRPLVFLLPADPAYYYGQDFVYFPCQPEEEGGEVHRGLLQAAGLPDAGKKYTWKAAVPEDAGELAKAANLMLERKYEVFLRRDEAYYRRLLAETACENGGIFIIRKRAVKQGQEKHWGYGPEGSTDRRTGEKSGIAGILVYGREEGGAEIKELIWGMEQEQEAGQICDCIFQGVSWKKSDMRMMARITDLLSLDGKLRSPGRTVRRVKVRDGIIPENNGCFRIQTGPDGGEIRRTEPEGTEEEVEISALAQQLFEALPVFIREWV